MIYFSNVRFYSPFLRPAWGDRFFARLERPFAAISSWSIYLGFPAEFNPLAATTCTLCTVSGAHSHLHSHRL